MMQFDGIVSTLPFHINLLATGSIPVHGSSKNTIDGSPIVAIATDNFLLLPPDKLPAILLSKSIQSNCLILLFTTSFNSLSVKPFILANNSKCSRTVNNSNNASNGGQYPILRRILL